MANACTNGIDTCRASCFLCRGARSNHRARHDTEQRQASGVAPPNEDAFQTQFRAKRLPARYPSSQWETLRHTVNLTVQLVRSSIHAKSRLTLSLWSRS
jgi:hypothetical protein